MMLSYFKSDQNLSWSIETLFSQYQCIVYVFVQMLQIWGRVHIQTTNGEMEVPSLQWVHLRCKEWKECSILLSLLGRVFCSTISYHTIFDHKGMFGISLLHVWNEFGIMKMVEVILRYNNVFLRYGFIILV